MRCLTVGRPHEGVPQQRERLAGRDAQDAALLAEGAAGRADELVVRHLDLDAVEVEVDGPGQVGQGAVDGVEAAPVEARGAKVGAELVADGLGQEGEGRPGVEEDVHGAVGVHLAVAARRGDGHVVHGDPVPGHPVRAVGRGDDGQRGQAARELGRVHAPEHDDSLALVLAAQGDAVRLHLGLVLRGQLVDEVGVPGREAQPVSDAQDARELGPARRRHPELHGAHRGRGAGQGYAVLEIGDVGGSYAIVQRLGGLQVDGSRGLCRVVEANGVAEFLVRRVQGRTRRVYP